MSSNVVERVKQIVLDWQSLDIHNIMAPSLHDDFKFRLFPSSLGVPEMNKQEYLSFYAGAREQLAEVEVHLTLCHTSCCFTLLT